MKKRILITGGAGFIGSNLAVYIKKKWPKSTIICLDNLIRRGSTLNARRIKDKGIKFIRGDIRNKKALDKIRNIDVLIDCSAEPSVLAGYQDPKYVLDTNLTGTLNCLELCRRDKAALIFLSTSRVYPIQHLENIPNVEKKTRFDWSKSLKKTGVSYKGINQSFPLDGVRSLYGATKLAAEHVCLEYFDMFGVPGIISRFGVIAGPWQMGKIDQGIVGFWVAKHKYRGKLSYIGYGGTGKQVRDILHVDDLCEIIFYQLRHLKKLNGEVFNIGGGRSRSVSLLELTELTKSITGINLNIKQVKKTRPSDIRIYMTDNSYLYKKTGWKPKKSLETIVKDVDSWIDQHHQILKPYIS